jgi:hypothetical protein
VRCQHLSVHTPAPPTTNENKVHDGSFIPALPPIELPKLWQCHKCHAIPQNRKKCGGCNAWRDGKHGKLLLGNRKSASSTKRKTSKQLTTQNPKKVNVNNIEVPTNLDTVSPITTTEAQVIDKHLEAIHMMA